MQRKVLFLIYFCLVLSSCRSAMQHPLQPYTVVLEDHSLDDADKTYFEYSDDWNITPRSWISNSKTILSFMIAENLIHSILGKDCQVSETNYYFYEKKYLDLVTYHVCFVNERFKRNGGYPCVEIEKKTEKILRITLTGALSPNEELSVASFFESPAWTKEEFSLDIDQRRIQNLGVFQSNLSYFFSNPDLWIEKVPVTYDWIAMNAADFIKYDEEDLSNYDCDIALHQLKDRNICEVLFSKKDPSMAFYGYHSVVCDTDTGQILGFCLQE